MLITWHELVMPLSAVLRLNCLLTSATMQVAATTLYHKALHQQLAADTQALPCAAATNQQQSTIALSSSSQHGADASQVRQVADIAIKREDEELHHKCSVERRGLPSSVDGFKYVL